MEKIQLSSPAKERYPEQMDHLEASLSQSILAAACITLILFLL